MTLSVVGRARGLMETLGSWISGKSSQGGVVPIQSLARRAPAPGILPTLLQGRQHFPPIRRVSGLKKAYVLLNVEIDSEKEVLDSLKEIPEVKEAYQIYAVYDLIIHIEADTSNKLKGLINRIRDIEKIRSTMTLICVKKG